MFQVCNFEPVVFVEDLVHCDKSRSSVLSAELQNRCSSNGALSRCCLACGRTVTSIPRARSGGPGLDNSPVSVQAELYGGRTNYKSKTIPAQAC